MKRDSIQPHPAVASSGQLRRRAWLGAVAGALALLVGPVSPVGARAADSATALEYKLPEALHAGSAEAYSVVAAAVSGDNGKETGEDRVARILNALKTTADDQASTLKDIKRALAARPGGFDF